MVTKRKKTGLEIRGPGAGSHSCDFESVRGESSAKSETQLHKFDGNFTWSDIEPEPYKLSSEDWARVVRHVIVGHQGEATKFHVRYFEIGPGGFSSLEKHEHAHVVIGIRGTSKVIAGAECYDLGYLDTIYIAPNTPHQLVNEADEPFGFFCLVDAERDRPQPLTEDELARLKASPQTRDVARF
jgi:quercetin dioxygenase-like cupin family protein